jgi:hypothetical protein
VSDLEVAVGRVVVADERQAVPADGHGRVTADAAGAVRRDDRSALERGVEVGDLQVAVAAIVEPAWTEVVTAEKGSRACG